MHPAATRPRATRASSTLSLAFELGNTEWKLAMTTRIDQAPLVRTMPARALNTLQTEIARAKTHFGLPASARCRVVTRPAGMGSGCIAIS
jgi:hypothetical protein